jgi:hypothetical protein
VSVHRFGWVPPEKRDYSVAKSHDKILESTRVMAAAGHEIKDTGEGKTVLLHKFLEKINGAFPVNRQAVGDCVSHGWSKGIETLMAVEILLKGEREDWPKLLTATEWIYGTSRVLVGGGRLGNGDGSLGSWAAKAVQEHGTLLRKSYGSVDLSKYSGQRAKEWGYRGLPSSELEPIADEHPVKTCALVTTYEEARDAIANGYPVPVCSNQGFTSTRDSEGFAKASGSWAHCMLFMAVDDAHRRPGLLCMNSWGPDWISGPKRHDQPEGSFWCDAETADRMLRGQDSYAISNFSGYPAREIDHNPFT